MIRCAHYVALIAILVSASFATAQGVEAPRDQSSWSEPFYKTPPQEMPHAVIKIDVAGYDETAKVYELDPGVYMYLVTADDGETKTFSPAEFTAFVYGDAKRDTWWKRILNISSPIGIAWVAIGLFGQLLFTGRMLVQWLVSEKEKRSVVPPIFWWMSLIGASMLLIYFGWRKDIVGILGQATGWFIYVRNLYFIKRAASIADDPAPEPELGD